MRTSLSVIFSIFLISSIMLVSSIDSSFADEIVATSTGFEDSTILELKNSRGNTANIESVRIWLGEGNDFKSFKTEKGWIGKNTPQGVIVFTTQNSINPGESVKFGIKTTEINPIINWKAIDSDGEVIKSASVKISEREETNPEFNEPKIVTIKEESSFRFIPEKPTSDSDFRVMGENFVPNQELDFYIGDKLVSSIKVDEDGKIFFTSRTPITADDERTEFVLRDSGGNEKSVSIRIPTLENREISEEIKLSLSNTPKEVKRGEVITLEGMATPNITLTITSTTNDGEIIAIDTTETKFDGKWSYDNLFSPELELGQVSIEINDGKTRVLRTLDVISAKLINISSVERVYEPGNSVTFTGTALPNQNLSLILEDAIGAEIFSRIVSVDDTGEVEFKIDIPRGSVEGTYVLYGFQGNEDGITVFGIGQEPEPILVLRPSKLNYATGQDASITIQGPPNAQVSLILIDSADREKFSDTVNLGPSGKQIYNISTIDLPNGSFTLNAKRGESSGSAIFTIGLTRGSGAIDIQTTRDEYKQGEQILILGSTGAINVLLDITIFDSEKNVVKKIETFSDRFGVFKVDNFRIPIDANLGEWSINAKSGGNFRDTTFAVSGESKILEIQTDKDSYSVNDIINISGSGARMSATIIMTILDENNEKIEDGKLNITAKSNGDFSTIWRIPTDLKSGEYQIAIDDGSANTKITFTIID